MDASGPAQSWLVPGHVARAIPPSTSTASAAAPPGAVWFDHVACIRARRQAGRRRESRAERSHECTLLEGCGSCAHDFGDSFFTFVCFQINLIKLLVRMGSADVWFFAKMDGIQPAHPMRKFGPN
jgi:hypothetical protein